MRKISEAQAALIREVVAEQPATYPPAALEKDLHLTEILKALRCKPIKKSIWHLAVEPA